MLKKKKFFIIIIAIISLMVVFTFGGCENSFRDAQIIQSNSSDMTMAFPKTWIDGPKSADASISMASKNAEYVVLSIEEPISNFKEGMTLDRYSDQLMEQMKTVDGTGNWDIGELEEVTIGKDIAGLQRVFTVSMTNSDKETLELKYLQTVFQTDVLFVEILAWSSPDSFDSAKKVFDNILLNVTPPTTAPAAQEAPADESASEEKPSDE